MKFLLTLFTALVFHAMPASAQDPNFHIFLCIGQSNMDGFPGLLEEDKGPVDERFRLLPALDFPGQNRKAGEWDTAVPPLSRPSSGLGPADYFGRTLLENLPKDHRVGVILVTIPGGRIEAFDPTKVEAYAAEAPDWLKNFIREYDGNPYQRLVELAKEARKSGVIRGILLHQGESNTGDQEWPAKVAALYDRLLDDLDLQATEVPLIAGEVVHADQNGACAGMNAIIQTLPESIPTAHVVSSKGCSAGDDRLHFTPEGYRILGKRYAGVMLGLLRDTPTLRE